MKLPRVLVLLLSVWTIALAAEAHEVRPAYLELRQTTADTFDMLWKVPAMGENLRLGLYVRLPDSAEITSEPRGMFQRDAYIERCTICAPQALVESTITIDGLRTTLTDVLVRIERLDGATQVARLTPEAPSLVFESSPSAWQVAWTYLVLGVEHILLGIDHLLFVLALVLLVKNRRMLVATITSFTVAHSVTLALATLGFVHVPGPPVEACIALSIVFVAAEIMRSRASRPGLTERAPWLIAFAFGLLHGLGFCRCPQRCRTAPAGNPARVAFLQRWCRTRAASLRRRSSLCDQSRPPPSFSLPILGLETRALRDWHRGDVLGD